jgi:iron complex outermembrane receptor protein
VFNWGFDIITKPGVYLNFIHNYRDGMPITSDNLNYATSYNLLNGKIGIRHTIAARLDMDVFFGANNLTGTQYPYMVFVNQLPDAYLPAPPKAVVFGGINLKYNIR